MMRAGRAVKAAPPGCVPPVLWLCELGLDATRIQRPVRMLATVDEAVRQVVPVGRAMARLDGDWLLPDDWSAERVGPGGVLEVFELPPEDDDTKRGVLTIAVIAASIWTSGAVGAAYGSGWGAAAGAVVSVLGNLAVNAVLPQQQGATAAGQAAGSAAFSASLTGNVAAIDAPIWKIFGRRKVTPPFAAEPYFTFVDNGDGTQDQYYYALLAVGEGVYTLERELLNDTAIAGFQDIVIRQMLAPGVAPTTVLANVTTVPEASNITLDGGRFTPEFPSCRPRRQSSTLWVDMMAPRGQSADFEWRVDVRPIDDFGVPLGAWATLATETRDVADLPGATATNTPQRWTSEYALPSDARYGVRLVRLDIKNTASTALHDLVLYALRSELAGAHTLNASTTHYEVAIRSTEQIGAGVQRQVALILTGHVRSLDVSLAWVTAAATRNATWHILEILTSTTMGLGYSDDRIDLQSFYDISLTAAARQDRCDYVLKDATDAWSAMQLLARTMRARVFRRDNGMISIARDEWLDTPVTAFHPRNCQGMALREDLYTPESFDGVIVEYEDRRSWAWVPIECPCPGVTTMTRPYRKQIHAITGATHALREGTFEAASMLWRRTFGRGVTELQGRLPTILSPVRWMPELRSYGQAGDVVDWDAGALTLTLSEPVASFAVTNYLTLMRDDGTPTEPVAVTMGATTREVVLPELPDFDPVWDDAARERTQYLIGPLATSDELVKVTNLSDAGATEDGVPQIGVDVIVDDERVHTADEAYLPVGEEVQDPISDYIGEDPGSLYIVRMLTRTLQATNTSGVGSSTGDLSATYTLNDDGTTDTETVSGSTGTSSATLANEWMQFGAVDPAVAALYEVMATVTSSTDAGGGLTTTFTGDVGTWEDFTQAWDLLLENSGTGYPTAGAVSQRVLRLDVRDKATSTLQASAVITLRCVYTEDPGGA